MRPLRQRKNWVIATEDVNDDEQTDPVDLPNDDNTPTDDDDSSLNSDISNSDPVDDPEEKKDQIKKALFDLQNEINKEFPPVNVINISSEIKDITKTDEEEIVALEALISDLTELRNTINTAGGMSQKFALEAQAIIPEFNKGKSLAYYSKDITAVEYRMALEEIDYKLMSAIAAAVAFLLGSIYKIYKWITGSGDNGGSNKSVAEKIEHQVETVKEVAVINNDAVKQMDRVSHYLTGFSGKALQVKSKDKDGNDVLVDIKINTLDDVINEYMVKAGSASATGMQIQNILAGDDPILADIISGGKYINAIRETLSSLVVRQTDIDVILRFILEFASDRDNLSSDVAAVKIKQHDFSAMEKRLDEQLYIIINDEKVSLHPKNNDLHHRLHQMHDEMMNKTGKPVSFDEALEKTKDVYHKANINDMQRNLSQVIAHLKKTEATLKGIPDAMKDFHYDGLGGQTVFYGTYIRNMLSTINNYVMVIGIAVKMAERAITGLIHTNTTILACSAKISVSVFELGTEVGIDPDEALLKNVYEYSEKIDKFKKSLKKN